MSLVVATILSWQSTGDAITSRAEGQEKPIDENLKQLGAIINGNIFEVGKRNSHGKYESYKYEDFRSSDCSINWREIHEAYDAGRRVLFEAQDLRAPLPVISPASVETNKISSSGYLVSFTTRKLEPGISARVHSVYEDGTENDTSSIATGYGFYFSDLLIAKRVGKALFSAIRSCGKAKGAWRHEFVLATTL